MTAEIPQPEGPQERIADRVRQDICIRVAQQSFIIRNFYTSQDERSSRNKTMHIVS